MSTLTETFPAGRIEIRQAVRDGVVRATAVVALAGVALIHLLDLPGKFTETPYMGALYVLLMIGCVLAAALLVRGSSRDAWRLAVLVPLGPMIGYLLTRTAGLPQATDDIGNWSEPLGMASLFVEGALVALAGAVLYERSRLRAPVRARPAEVRLVRAA